MAPRAVEFPPCPSIAFLCATDFFPKQHRCNRRQRTQTRLDTCNQKSASNFSLQNLVSAFSSSFYAKLTVRQFIMEWQPSNEAGNAENVSQMPTVGAQ